MNSTPDITIIDLLRLEQIDTHRFRSVYHRENFHDTLFGGQVLGQALAAACATVEARYPHSLHAYFLRPGNNAEPVDYHTEVLRNGRSFSTRRTVASQYGKAIFTVTASFHSTEPGFSHQPAMPSVPAPESLPLSDSPPRELVKRDAQTLAGNSDNPLLSDFDVRNASDTVLYDTKIQEPKTAYWFKSRYSLPEQNHFHHCALAYLSDIGLLASSLLPHPTALFKGDVMVASIDHAMWFHTSDFRVDDWLLYCIESPWAGGARGFGVSRVYTRDGVLVASASQEGLIRPL